MKKNNITPESILRLTSAHWALKALAVAVDLEIFTELNNENLSVDNLSDKINVPKRSLSKLLNANVALGFLEKKGNSFRNSEIALTYLVLGKPAYLGDFVKLAGIHGFTKWTKFDECVKKDLPIENLDDNYRQNEKMMQYFTRAMHNNAKRTASMISSLPITENRNHLIDVGGGSGIYSIAMLEQNSKLTATLVDFPPVCKVAYEYINDSKVSDRINVIENDFLTTNEIESGDIVLVSQVLHSMSENDCNKLLKKCFKLTNLGGALIIHDFILDETGATPLYPTLFALNMLMTTKEGTVYKEDQINNWLKDIGYSNISTHDTNGQSKIITAIKE